MLTTVVLVCIIAILLRALFPSTLPYPYETIPIQPLKDASDDSKEQQQQEQQHQRIQRIQNAFRYFQSKDWKEHPQKRSLQDNLQILFNGTVLGAESVAIRPGEPPQLAMLDKFGYLHLASLDGTYLSSNDKNQQPPLPYIGPGRPLGYEFLDRNTLIVADSLKGLVQVTLHKDDDDGGSLAQKDIEVTILSNAVNGEPINYVNDLDIDHTNQIVYFTSSTRGTVAYNANEGHYDTMRSFLLNMYSGDVSGRLLQYNLQTKETTVLIDNKDNNDNKKNDNKKNNNLWYANGVTLSHNRDYVLVVETCGFRVIRKWLNQDKEEQPPQDVEDFITNLPGAPDGITRSSDGENYWISLVVPISPLLQFIESPRMRYVLSLLQFQLDITKHFLKQWGCVIKVSPNGTILDVLIDPTGSTVSTISAVTEYDGKLYLGNLGGSFVSIFDLSSTAATK